MCLSMGEQRTTSILIPAIRYCTLQDGIGIVANESEEIEMKAGDTAFIPAGEKHWHGASDDHDFFHISLTRPDSQTEMFLPE
ncbi:MAG: hypothetical protein CL794_03910 [Chloroflexi bacterium]|nr:hypothetical protein [Chloroflexota bacterium]